MDDRTSQTEDLNRDWTEKTPEALAAHWDNIINHYKEKRRQHRANVRGTQQTQQQRNTNVMTATPVNKPNQSNEASKDKNTQ